MGPMTVLSAVGVGSKLLGALKGNSAEKKQAALEQQKYADNQRLQNEQLELARELQRQGVATQVDAQGNVTFYDKATNTWKSVLSAGQQRLQDASDTESLRNLTVDASANRGERERNAARRIEEGGVASALLDQMKQRIANPTYSADTIGANTRLENLANVAAAYDRTANDAATLNLRRGVTADAGQLSKLAQARRSAMAQMNPGTYLNSLMAAQQLNSNDVNNVGNLYNTMASRASNIDNTPITPQNPGAGLAAALAASRSSGTNGTTGAINGITAGSATGARVPLPDNTANAGGMLADFGTLLGNFADGQGGDIGSFLANAMKKRTPSTMQIDPIGTPNLGNRIGLPANVLNFGAF